MIKRQRDTAARQPRPDIDYVRQHDLFPPDEFATPITVIGAGALGSYVVWLLAKMGCREITVFDSDSVARHNLPNQIFGLREVRQKKVTALREVIRRDMGITIAARPVRFVRGPLHGMVFACVDSMKARRAIWESSVRRQPAVELFIDARMGAEGGRVYAVRPTVRQEVDGYEQTLYTDAEAAENPCARRAIAPTVVTIAGLAVSAMLNAVRGYRVVNEVIVSLRPLLLLHQQFS